MAEDNGKFLKVLEWIINIDIPALKASVDAMKRKYPKSSKHDLAERIFSRARWKATAAGAATGLPTNPWVAVPAATTDVAVTLRTEVHATAMVALIFDENFFDDEDAVWELLVPVFGINVVSQFARELGIMGGMGLTRAAIRKYLSKQTLSVFKKVLLKYFGKKVTQKALLTKVLPIVGAFIGGLWNWVEVSRLKKRAIKYFEGNGSQSLTVK